MLFKDYAFENEKLNSIIEIIEMNPFRLAVIILKKNKKLIGTITDGDIRRFLLKGNSLNSVAKEIMNKNHISVSSGTSIKTIANLCRKFKIRGIPVVDSNGIFLEVVYPEKESKNTQKKSYNNNLSFAVIMAGGEGKRLRPLTKKTPKPMLKVDGIPLLERQIISLRDIGIKNIYLSVNYLSDIIKDYFRDGKDFGINIFYVNEKSKMGTAGSLRLLPENKLADNILVLNGDILTNFDFDSLLEFHIKNSSDITVTAINYQIEVPFGVIKNQGSDILKIVEKPSQNFLCNAGIYILSRSVLETIPINKFYNMTDLIEKSIKMKCKVNVFPIYEYWSDIGTAEDLKRANNLSIKGKTNENE